MATKTSSSYAPIGLEVPFVRGTGGYFQQTFDTNSQVKQNLMNFLKTKKGERRMSPEFGTKLYELVFEQRTDNLNEIAKNILFEEISYWIPEVTIDEIEIINVENPVGDDNYKLRISVSFTIKQTKTEDSVTFDLQSVNI